MSSFQCLARAGLMGGVAAALRVLGVAVGQVELDIQVQRPQLLEHVAAALLPLPQANAESCIDVQQDPAILTHR